MKEYWSKQKDYPDYTLFYSKCDTLLDEKEKLAILTDLDKGLPDYDVFQYFNAQPTIFSDYSHLVIARENTSNETIGLLGTKAFSSKNFDFLYFWTAMINAKYHRSSLLLRIYVWLFSNIIENDKFYNVLATKTYNPVVYYLFQKNKKLLGEQVGLYPHINIPNDQKMLEYAREVFNAICPSLALDEETGCVFGGQAVLAPNFFPKLPDCNDEIIYNHFKNNLTYKDQILSVLHIPSFLEDVFKVKILNNT